MVNYKSEIGLSIFQYNMIRGVKDMKRKLMIAATCVAMVCLTACQGKKTVAESCWNSAKKASGLETYIKEQGAEMDVEALKAEAGSSENSLSQQFKAAALLSGLEYYGYLEGDCSSAEAFRMDYPVSGPYVEQYLQKVNMEGEDFWNSFEDTFYPYDCFLPMFAAAYDLDGQTLVKLTEEIPEDSNYDSKLEDAIEAWVKNKPEQIVGAGSEFINSAYFEDWDLDDWKSNYFYNHSEDGPIYTDSGAEALAYIGFLRESMLPELEAEFGRDKLLKKSEIEGESYYDTNLTVTIDEPLQLKEPEESGLPEVIETEGKKTVAFYQNPHTDEFEGSPAPLRMLGDFMLGLPQEEFPATVEEADYYLVLTPSYEGRDYYKDQSGKDSKIQQVYSSTSIDLYEAKTGTFLRHLGYVMEEPQDTIYENLAVGSLKYPKLTAADILSYIYHNINEPEKYVTLTDQTAGGNTELQSGESVVLGSWEITYHSAKVMKSFDNSIYRFTAKDGHQFVRAKITITNRGMEKETFLPMIYSLNEDPVVQITDSKRETFYNCVDVLSFNSCLNGTSLEPGETEEGEVIFEVPDEMLNGTEPVYMMASLGRQNVFYLLER